VNHRASQHDTRQLYAAHHSTRNDANGEYWRMRCDELGAQQTDDNTAMTGYPDAAQHPEMTRGNGDQPEGLRRCAPESLQPATFGARPTKSAPVPQ
jgi:hypothetical protein